MNEIDPILIGKGEYLEYLLPAYSNRHGLITGATGTGKTVSLQVLADGFSRIGVPVFLADVKGDLAGLSQPNAAATASQPAKPRGKASCEMWAASWAAKSHAASWAP
jgi:DNA helicase HerA-like ATPase